MLYRWAYNRFNEINLSCQYDNANAKQDVIELRIGFVRLVQNVLLRKHILYVMDALHRWIGE